jgi:D-tyrosyl-tRNA(Tyr) deacylase
MRAVIQRVTRAAVTVDGETVGSIGPGLVVLLGVADGDGPEQANRLAAKIAELRIFADAGGRFNRSLIESGGEALVVSQFTLLADVRKGRRPSFVAAAAPEDAAPLVDLFAEALRAQGIRVAAGRFGAHMLVELENDGPVTLVVDTADLNRPRRGSDA